MYAFPLTLPFTLSPLEFANGDNTGRKTVGDVGRPCTLPSGSPPCPPNAPYELPPTKIRGKCYRNCTALQTTTVPTTSGDDIYYPRQDEVPPPPLNVPSRTDQKKNIFTRAFDPNFRKVLVLVIAGFLLFLAVTNAD